MKCKYLQVKLTCAYGFVDENIQQAYKSQKEEFSRECHDIDEHVYLHEVKIVINLFLSLN